MSLEAETRIAHSVDEVIRAYSSRDFHDHLASRFGATLLSFEVSGDTSGEFTITSEQTMPVDKLPDIARKVIRGDVRVTVTDRWAAPAADGARSSEMTVKLGSAPVSAAATQTLKPEGESATVSTVHGEVNTSIPLIGKKLKAAAEPYLAKFVDRQAREVSAWLAENS